MQKINIDAFQVCERHVGIDPEALELMKHRRVGGVTIDPVSLTRCNYTDGRAMGSRISNLHRTRVGAQ